MRLLDVSSPKYPNAIAKVDDVDFELVSQFKWYRDQDGYIVRAETVSDGRRIKIRLHNFLANPPYGLIVDHIDRDPGNNQRSNFRFLTRFQNNHNRGPNSSKLFKGVFIVPSGKWRAAIQVNGKCINLGLFVRIVDAACEYDKAAIRYVGSHCYRNFPSWNKHDEAKT